MSQLSSDDRRKLLQIARQSIHEGIVGMREWVPPRAADALAEPRGAFVTLHIRGRLRGCIGQIGPVEPLAETVAHCALAAAREDPRFDPVEQADVPEVEIEISVLSPFEAIRHAEIEVGRHGLLVVQRGRRGLLLPQVATEHHWTADRFLEETCKKAGLDPRAWEEPETLLFAFTAEIFSEAEFRNPAPSHPSR